MNSRFLAMGAALGPSLPGGPLKRAAQGQTVVDASWAMASRGDGTFDRWMLFGASATQFATWQTGTVIGALSADLIGDPERLGLDALFPAFFLALLMAEARTSRARAVAALGGLIASGAGADRARRRARAGGRRRGARRPHALGPRRRGEGAEVSTIAIVIGGVAITTAAVKAVGPVALGGRDLPDWFSSVVVLLAPALLAALVATQALADGDRLTIDEETAGVAAGGLLYWRTESIIGCGLLSAALTAALRPSRPAPGSSSRGAGGSRTSRPCSAASRAAISERWHASGSRSTHSSAAGPSDAKLRDDRLQVHAVQDLPRVALDVSRRQLGARALAHTAPRVLGVLELAQLGGGRQLGVMAVSRCPRRRAPPGAGASSPTRTARRAPRGAGARPAPGAFRPPPAR